MKTTATPPPGAHHGNSPGDLVLRRIRPDDWRLQRALRLEMLTDTPIAYLETLESALSHPDEYWKARVEAHALSTTSAQWVLDDGDRLVGTMGCLQNEAGRAEIVAVYLSPAYRGRGYLDLMLDEVAQWARERNVTTMALTVAKENESAVAAYRRRGFVATGFTYPHPLYPEITEMEMTRPVDPEERPSD